MNKRVNTVRRKTPKMVDLNHAIEARESQGKEFEIFQQNYD